MSGRRWRVSERILLMAVVLFAVLAVYRWATSEPAAEPETPPPQRVDTHRPAPVAATPSSPAGAEVLARIRSCSGKELEGIVDSLAGTEALVLYQQLTVADRQAVLSALPAPMLAKKAHELLGVPESCFRHAGMPGLLASSLADAAMGTPLGPVDAKRKTLVFAPAVDAQGVPQGPRNVFRADERKIHACLEAGAKPAGDPGVLVRWIEEGSGALVYLHYLPLSVNRHWNHVYFEVKATWPSGTYRVGFYRIGKSVSLLAEGTYVVE